MAELDKAIESINTLESGVKASRKSLNNVIDLLEYAKSEDEGISFLALKALSRCFIPEIKRGNLIAPEKAETEAAERLQTWLHAQYSDFLAQFERRLVGGSEAVQAELVPALVALAREEGQRGLALAQTALRLIEGLLTGPGPKLAASLVTALQAAVHYEDVKITLLRMAGRLATTLPAANQHTMRKLQQLLGLLHYSLDSSKEEHLVVVAPPAADGQSAKRQKTKKPNPARLARKLYSQTWIAFLKLKMTPSMYKRALLEMKEVIARLAKPLVLIDFLCDAYTQGGVSAVLALDGLFELITKHNLDYPKFFHQLYAILEAKLFSVAYRVRFIELLHLALSSQYVSGLMVAAFCKRLARIALVSTASNTLLLLTIIYNLLLRHPSVRCLIHKTAGAGELILNLTDQTPVEDVYNATTNDPEETRALESYLWELTAFKNHASPAVSRFVTVFEKEWRKMPYSLEQFLTSSGEQLFQAELRRRPKAGVPFEPRPRRTLFAETDLFSRLWRVQLQAAVPAGAADTANPDADDL